MFAQDLYTKTSVPPVSAEPQVEIDIASVGASDSCAATPGDSFGLNASFNREERIQSVSRRRGRNHGGQPRQDQSNLAMRGHASISSAKENPEDVPPADTDSRTEVQSQSSPESPVGSLLPKYHPSRLMVDYSIFCTIGWLVVIIGFITFGLLTLDLQIETDFSSFVVTDVESSIKEEVVNKALASRAGQARRLDVDTTTHVIKHFYLYYEITEMGNGLRGGLFHSKSISAISKFEKSLTALPEWQKICNDGPSNELYLCKIGMGLRNYMMPSRSFDGASLVPSSLIADGNGFEPINSKVAMSLMHNQGQMKLILPEDAEDDFENKKLQETLLARTSFKFSLACCSSEDDLATTRRLKTSATNDWKQFLKEIVLPKIKETELEIMEDERFINIWYDGSDVDGIEVLNALEGDLYLVVMAFVYVHLYMYLHTQSIILAMFGPIITLLAVPLTFVLCGFMIDATTLSFANFLALFLIVGFGADVIFVYTDFWHESEESCSNLPDRMNWTLQRAIRSSLTTTGTTALAFFANLASVIRALRRFGFFMGMCFIMTWMVINLVYVPLLVTSHRLNQCTPGGRKWSVSDKCTCCKGRGVRKKLIVKWINFISYRRRAVVMIFLLLMILFLGLTIPNITVADGLPNIFPEDHNQNKGAKIRDEFTSPSKVFGRFFKEPLFGQEVCADMTAQSCGFHWCETSASNVFPQDVAQWPGHGDCNCMLKKSTSNCFSAEFHFAGPPEVTKTMLDVARNYVDATTDFEATGMETSGSKETVILQDWESGDVTVMEGSEVGFKAVRKSSPGNANDPVCGLVFLCFCGTERVCEQDGNWTVLPKKLRIPTPTGGRRLALSFTKPTIPVSKRLKVKVVFGIKLPKSISLLSQKDLADSWKFLEWFDIRQPWTQRDMVKFCQETKSNVLVTRMWCWPKAFYDWTKSRGKRFPLRAHEFHEISSQYMSSDSATHAWRYLWLQGGQVQALYLSIETNFRKTSSHDKTLEYKEVWDNHLDKFNQNAFVSSRGAFHVSQAWVQAESTSILLISTAQTFLLLLGLAFVAILLFTWSLGISVIVMASTATVIIGLMFFITVVNNWDVGLIEVIAIIYFIGYAIDYSLHIGYKYVMEEGLRRPSTAKNRNDERYCRTSFAIKTMGGAVLGSALTTAGAALCLVFCRLNIFAKLGAMCLAVTVMSVLVALGPLPAALMLCGPKKPGCNLKCLSFCSKASTPPRE